MLDSAELPTPSTGVDFSVRLCFTSVVTLILSSVELCPREKSLISAFHQAILATSWLHIMPRYVRCCYLLILIYVNILILAVFLSGIELISINVVAVRWARLVLGLVGKLSHYVTTNSYICGHAAY